MREVEILFIYFTIYSFIGWLCEVVYCSYLSRRIVNRGFLAGPVCPVYGFGALFLIWLLEPVAFSIPIIFICGLVITSTLEYITGWLLETFFGTRWWDYSNQKFNLEGRVCLKNSIYFGIMSVILIKLLHPTAEKLIWIIPEGFLHVICVILVAYFAVDCSFTLNTLVNLNQRLQKLYEFTEELRKTADIQEWFNERELVRSFEKLRLILEEGKSNLNQKIGESKIEINHMLEEKRNELNSKLRERFEALTAKRGSGHRLIKAFPGMRSIRYNTQLGQLREALKELKQRVKGKE